MRTIPLLLLVTSLFSQVQASETLLAEGQLEPASALTHASGKVSVIREDDGSPVVAFGDDYEMSSGVVLDLKTCGLLDRARPDERVCFSQAEVRKLRGPHRLAIRFPLEVYQEVVIFDVDVAHDHARAVLK